MSGPTSPADILRAARELISTPERWTQVCEARDPEGNNISPKSPDAVCWCSVGAIHRVADGDSSFAAEFLRLAIGRDSIGGWNDRSYRTHTEVTEAFDRALALAEQATS